MSSRDPTPLAGPIEPLTLAADPAGLGKGFSASIGKKYLMGWTGLFWSFFLLAHLAGNMTIFVGAEALNDYAAKLASLGALLYVAEAGLAALLIVHVVLAIMVTLENSAARPVGYAAEKGKGGSTLASKTMIWTGIFGLGFLILHLINIKLTIVFGGDQYLGADGHADVYKVTIAVLSNPLYGLIYIVAVCLLGFHVSHGVQSAFRTIGVHGKRITPKIEMSSVLFGFLVAIGYGILPIWAMLTKGGGA